MGGKHFDKAAAGWDQKQRRVELAAAIAAGISKGLPLHPDMAALEYGCGTGLVGLALAPFVASLVAVDTSGGMLEVLSRKIAEDRIANVTPMQLDLLQDALPGRFDLVFCSMVLHHVREADRLLARFHELLNPGGFLAVADLFAEDGSFHGPEADGVMHYGFDPADLEKRLTGMGMNNVVFSQVHSIFKPGKDGNGRSYPVFLLIAGKER